MRRLTAVLFTAAPFVAGAVAAASVRHDLRMLWMATAATIVARLVLIAATARWERAAAAGAALAAATLVSSAVAVLAGARAVFGIVAVAVVLAGCATAGAALDRRTRSAAT